MEYLNIKNDHKVILGLFFSIYPTYAYSFLGNVGKYVCIAYGLVLLFQSTRIIQCVLNNFVFFIGSLVYVLLLLYIPVISNQKTSEPIYIVFDIICFYIFLVGYSLSKAKDLQLNISSKIKNILSLLVIVGVYFLYQIQKITVKNRTSRFIEDEYLNSNGIAYMTSILLLIFLYLIKIEQKKTVKYMLILASLALTFTLIMTESRGAMLYLFTTVVLLNINAFKRFITVTGLIRIIAVLIIVYIFYSYNATVASKVDTTIHRFELALEFTENVNKDGGLKERLQLQHEFFTHFDKMYLGYDKYKPYPHNQFIEMYMRWGVFCLPLFLMSIYAFIKAFFRIITHKQKNHFSFLILSIFMFVYLQSMTSLSLDNNRFLWLGMGFVVGLGVVNFDPEMENHQ